MINNIKKVAKEVSKFIDNDFEVDVYNQEPSIYIYLETKKNVKTIGEKIFNQFKNVPISDGTLIGKYVIVGHDKKGTYVTEFNGTK